MHYGIGNMCQPGRTTPKKTSEKTVDWVSIYTLEDYKGYSIRGLENYIFRQQLRDALIRAMRVCLTEKQCLALTMRYFDYRSYDEIGECLNVSKQTACVTCDNAIESIRRSREAMDGLRDFADALLGITKPQQHREVYSVRGVEMGEGVELLSFAPEIITGVQLL